MKPHRLSATSAIKNIISQKKRFKKCSKEFKIKLISAQKDRFAGANRSFAYMPYKLFYFFTAL